MSAFKGVLLSLSHHSPPPTFTFWVTTVLGGMPGPLTSSPTENLLAFIEFKTNTPGGLGV
jgi:hypothetical protein